MPYLICGKGDQEAKIYYRVYGEESAATDSISEASASSSRKCAAACPPSDNTSPCAAGPFHASLRLLRRTINQDDDRPCVVMVMGTQPQAVCDPSLTVAMTCLILPG